MGLNQAQREKINLCRKLEMKYRLFQESRARHCQEIWELRRICCEETDRARQLRIDELSAGEESYFCESALDSNSEFAEQGDFRGRRNENFYDPETASSSGASHVPSQPLIFPRPRGMLSRDSGLPLDTRNTMGVSGNVFDSLPAREGPSSALFEISRDLTSYPCGLGSGTTGNIMTVKGSVAMLKSLYNLVVYLKILIREHLFHVNLENWVETRRQFLQGHVAPHKNSGKKGSIARRHSKV